MDTEKADGEIRREQDAHLARYESAIRVIKERLEDAATMIEADPTNNGAAGFLRATAKRCQRVLDGKSFNGEWFNEDPN